MWSEYSKSENKIPRSNCANLAADWLWKAAHSLTGLVMPWKTSQCIWSLDKIMTAKMVSILSET